MRRTRLLTYHTVNRSRRIAEVVIIRPLSITQTAAVGLSESGIVVMVSTEDWAGPPVQREIGKKSPGWSS